MTVIQDETQHRQRNRATVLAVIASVYNFEGGLWLRGVTPASKAGETRNEANADCSSVHRDMPPGTYLFGGIPIAGVPAARIVPAGPFDLSPL